MVRGQDLLQRRRPESFATRGRSARREAAANRRRRLLLVVVMADRQRDANESSPRISPTSG